MMRWRVVCALEVMIDSFSPTRAFISVDFQTLGFPMIFTKPDLCIFLLGYDPDKGSDKKRPLQTPGRLIYPPIRSFDRCAVLFTIFPVYLPGHDITENYEQDENPLFLRRCRAGRVAFSMALQEVPSVVAIIIGYVQFPADLLSTATL